MTLSLCLRELVVTSDHGRVLLQVPQFDLTAGQALGLRGPSGAGKSTFLFAISGLIPVQGQVQWGDHDFGNMRDLAQFRSSQMGMVFQDLLMVEELTAFENAAVSALFRPAAQRAKIRDTARKALQGFGVAALDHSVTRQSGGERQRVAVARALAHDPAAILADEPTASLDRVTADAVIDDLLAQVRGAGKTLIVASHDPVLLARLDRVITLESGRITEDSA